MVCNTYLFLTLGILGVWLTWYVCVCVKDSCYLVTLGCKHGDYVVQSFMDDYEYSFKETFLSFVISCIQVTQYFLYSARYCISFNLP